MKRAPVVENRYLISRTTRSFVSSATLLFAAVPLIHPKYRPSLKMSLSENLHAAPVVHEYVCALTRAERMRVLVFAGGTAAW